jgi:DNA mismatch repair ATPase MutL
LGPVRFKRSMFRDLNVIGQMDRKFIAATIRDEDDEDDEDDDERRKGGRRRILVLFDQHAVHERIRLETLIKGNIV